MYTEKIQCQELKNYLTDVNPIDRMEELIQQELKLAQVKGHDYAAGGQRTGNFDRVSRILEQYPDLKLSDPRVVCVVYLLKQLDSILWGLNTGIKKKAESVGERTMDISIYAKLYQIIEETYANQ